MVLIWEQLTICGGSNTGHFAAAVCGSKPNITVNLLTQRPKEWKSEIIGYTKGSIWENRGEIVGKLNKVSDSPKEVCAGSNVYLICGPAHIHFDLLQKIAPFVEPNSYVGTIFGQGGFDWMAYKAFGKELQSKNLVIFGLQNVPSITQKKEYGASVRIIGPKKVM